MKWIISRYNHKIGYIKDYTDDVVMYDRSEVPIEGSIVVPNVGNADYDKLCYLVDNYDNLPAVFFWGKANLFDYIKPKEFEHIKDNKTFTPILSQDHHTYEPICRYKDGMYQEINNSWYLSSHSSKYFNNYNEFAIEFGLPTPEYLAFNPGGNFILTKEVVHKYPKEFYERLRDLLPYTQLPGEAHFCERSYYTMWS